MFKPIFRYLFVAGWLVIPAGLGADYTDGVAAVVGDEVITVSDIVRNSAPAEQSLRQHYQGEKLAERVQNTRKEVARRMIQEQLLFQEYKNRDLQLPKDYVDKRLDRKVVEVAGGNYEKFENILATQGMTMTDYREELKKQLAAQIIIDQFVRRQVEVTRQDIRNFYEDNQSRFQRPAAVHLRVIFLKGQKEGETLERAKAILQKLEKGAAFEELAEAESDDPASAGKGGDLGWIEIDAGRQVFIQAVEGLERGEISEPVVQPEGVYILKLVNLRKTKIPEFDQKLQQQIREALEKKQFNQQFDAFMEELRQKYFVKTYFD